MWKVFSFCRRHISPSVSIYHREPKASCGFYLSRQWLTLVLSACVLLLVLTYSKQVRIVPNVGKPYAYVVITSTDCTVNVYVPCLQLPEFGQWDVGVEGCGHPPKGPRISEASMHLLAEYFARSDGSVVC
jgi:hypothetical protein